MFGVGTAYSQSRVQRRNTLGANAISSANGPTVSHSVNLNWVASTSASCLTSVPATCTAFGYNVYRGTSPGGESITPENSLPVTSVAYSDPVILPGTTVTYYYIVEAVETTSDGITQLSVPSNEVSVTFQAAPAPPTNVTATKQ